MAETMSVPLADLSMQHEMLQPTLGAKVAEVVASSAFIDGPAVAEFEQSFAAAQGVPFVVGCANGTDAIYIVLKVLGIGPGDEVIVPANTWISTAEVVTQAGASIVFADVDDYFHLDLDSVEAAITPRTRAVIGVHLYGQAFDVTGLLDICRRNGIQLVEDAAQAHGATWHGSGLGGFGVAGTFSFFPAKNIGAWGDAGCVATTDEALARQCRRYAHHGALRRHEHEVPGINSRLDSVQAAVLNVKIPHLTAWNDRRRAIASRYSDALAELTEIVTPKLRDGAGHGWHQYVIRVLGDRDALARGLADKGIATGIHYPRALHLTEAYAGTAKPGSLPVAERNQEQILSLPMYPEMTDEQVEYVISGIKSLSR